MRIHRVLSGLVISDLRLERAKRRHRHRAQMEGDFWGKILTWIHLDLRLACKVPGKSSKDILPLMVVSSLIYHGIIPKKNNLQQIQVDSRPIWTSQDEPMRSSQQVKLIRVKKYSKTHFLSLPPQSFRVYKAEKQFPWNQGRFFFKWGEPY